MTDLRPTDEQQTAMDLFDGGLTIAVDALAGSGKTSLLVMMAEATRRRGQYVAFNTLIVRDAAKRLPAHVDARTMHSVAFRAVGRRYAHRLEGGRVRSDRIARLLGVDPLVVSYGEQRKVLQPGFLAGLVMRSVVRFCESADPAPSRRHVPYIDGIDPPTDDGARTWANNDAVRDAVEPFLHKAWADLNDPDGSLVFRHDHYLKIYELSGPQLGVDFLLLDEAQDLSPVMLSVVLAQQDCQLVVVGDVNQSVYGWRGAVNAMKTVDVDARAALTMSFRFGPRIAEVANGLLAQLPTALRVRGNPEVESSVDRLNDPRAILCRTNAGAMQVCFEQVGAGRRPVLFGGGRQVAAFARAARDLMDKGYTSHPELACFDSWPQVLEYVADDAQGDELALMVGLVTQYGPAAILEALEAMPDEDHADVVVATAHAVKGRQWPTVKLHSDFRDGDDPDGSSNEETRLSYVSVTRAQYVLDPYDCPALKSVMAAVDRGVDTSNRVEVGRGPRTVVTSGTGSVSPLDRWQNQGWLRTGDPDSNQERSP